MPPPRVFISSTYYDLKHIRSTLDRFVEGLGFTPILSEKGDIAYASEKPLDESCYREAATADIFLLIVGGRYGSAASEGRPQSGPEFYERYDSITKRELEAALEAGVPVYTAVDRAVHAELSTFRRNRARPDVTYAQVDSINVFLLLDFILSLPNNNAVFPFDRPSELEDWLRAQWAGMFGLLLRERSTRAQLLSLQGQVSSLSEITKTLKRYLEEVLQATSRDEGAKVIKSEESRLLLAKLSAKLLKVPFSRLLLDPCMISLEEQAEMIRKYPNSSSFISVLQQDSRCDKIESVLIDWLSPPGSKMMEDDYQYARKLLRATHDAEAARRGANRHEPLRSYSAPRVYSLPTRSRSNE